MYCDKAYLDWPFFEDSHRQLAAQLDAWCAAHLPVAHCDVDNACIELVKMLGDGGWLKHSSIDPDAQVLAPLDVRSLCLIRETLARYDALADFAFAMQGLGTGAISLFGSDEQRQWLKQTRSGETLSAFALTEAQSGSDVANITMTATRDGDSYLLNGEKTWISNGGIAGLYCVFARTSDERAAGKGAKGLSAFIVEANTPGFSITERLQTIAPHPLATLSFDNVRISASNLIGAEGEGFKIAMSVLDVFRSTVGAAALGFAKRALAESVARVESRELFGNSLIELQMVQGHIAQMALDVDAAALLVYRAAWTKDNGAARVTKEAAMAKLYATDNAQKVIDSAVQLHGGDGVRSGTVVETLYRDIRALRIYEGASDVQKIVIARQVMQEAQSTKQEK